MVIINNAKLGLFAIATKGTIGLTPIVALCSLSLIEPRIILRGARRSL